MNGIQKFTNERLNVSVRIVDREGEPWFVGNDVAAALGYARPRKAVLDHCKGGTVLGLPSETSDSGVASLTIIPESDVYRLVLRSKKPQAEAFQDWIVEDILPSIRKTGAYMTDEAREGTSRELFDAALDRILTQRDQIRGLEAITQDCAPRVPYGAISERTGQPMQQLVRAYWRTARRQLEPPPWLQLTLFGMQ